MASLTGKTPGITYKDLLHMDNGNLGLTGSLRPVLDGNGAASKLELSTSGVNVDGTFTVGGAAVGGAWSLLSTQTASASSSIDFNSSLIDGTFKNYLVVWNNAIPSVDNIQLTADVSINNGSSFVNASAHVSVVSNASAAYNAFIISSTRPVTIHNAWGNNTNESISGWMVFSDPANTAVYKNAYGNFNAFDADTVSTGGMISHTYETTSAINFIRFAGNAGVITSGTWKLYGIN